MKAIQIEAYGNPAGILTGNEPKADGRAAGPPIFRNQTVRGFWFRYWDQSASPDVVAAMFDRPAPLVAARTISTPVAATHGFDQVGEALASAAQSGGTVLFTPNACCENACQTDGGANHVVRTHHRPARHVR
jgi:hypothetical protein